MSKMMNCKVCGQQIAKSAKVCPGCGAKNKRTSLFTWLFGGMFLIALVVTIVGQNAPQNGTGTAASTAAAAPAIDCSQTDERKALVQKLLNQEYFNSVQYTDGVARISVMPSFVESLKFEDKQQFISVAALVNRCEGGDLSVRIIDAMNNETIGFYSENGLDIY